MPSEQSLECGRLGRTWQPRSFSVAARPAPSLAPVNALFLALRGLRLLFADVRSASGTAQRLARQQVFVERMGGWMDGWMVGLQSIKRTACNKCQRKQTVESPSFSTGQALPLPRP